MTQVGDLQTRLYFDRRAEATDEYGGTRADFQQQFARWADVTFRLGGEQVTAARLAGRQPVNITVRSDSQTLEITTEWRARDAAEVVYNIKSVAPNGRWIFILAEVGQDIA